MEVLGALSSGAETLQWLAAASSKQIPDLIVSDVEMPVMSGYQLAVEIKKNEKYKQIKIIASSSDSVPGAAARAKDSGFDAYLSKPIIRKDLIRVIQTVIGDQRTDGQIVTRHMAEEVSCKGIKVLVAEDNPINQKLFKVMLANLGCEVDMVSDGQEAVDRIKQKPYDIVLMDLQMPKMGGVDATKLIRRDINKNLPIVALTAAAMEEDKKRALDSGMNGYLTKPVELAKLKDYLLKFTGRA